MTYIGICAIIISRITAIRQKPYDGYNFTAIYGRTIKMEGRTAEEKQGITLLGNQKTKYPDDYAPQVLETFVNKHQDNDYFVKFNCPEFTSL